MPHLKPVGHQSTNWIVRLVLMVATAAFTSFGTTSPEMKKSSLCDEIGSLCEHGNSASERDLFGMLSLPDPNSKVKLPPTIRIQVGSRLESPEKLPLWRLLVFFQHEKPETNKRCPVC